MATRFNDNAAINDIVRVERVEWLGGSFIPDRDDTYYTKTIDANGRQSKQATTYEGGKWQLGSGELAGIRVWEWMRVIS